MIQIAAMSLLRGSKVLLDESSATLHAGQKMGVIGPNGCGKSSLFALLRGELHCDTGDCSVPQDWRIVSVAQETPALERSAIDYVIDGDSHLRQLQQQLSDAEAAHQGERIAELHGALQDAGGYDVESRAASILNGLGFAQRQLQNPVSAFSGGWRMRLNLAQALLCPSDLLLLDEPTNHLDLDAVLWLEKWLERYTGTLLLISHDQAFLDACVTHILSFENRQLFTYSGGYSAFERQQAERLRQQQLTYEKQQAKAAHLQSFIDRFRAKASKAKQAQSRIKQLEKMQLALPVQLSQGIQFQFPEPDKLPNPLVQMRDIQVGYQEHIILNKVKLNLVPGSRIGLLGRNGAGKSTLIKLLAGDLQPKAGEYSTSAGLKIGYFAQHQIEFLRLDDSPLTHLQLLDKKATEQSLRDFLGGFGFHGDEALAPVGPMSGGEKARVVLALLVYQKPNLLLLDEPTNHLDMHMRHALNLALQSFSGAMILVSHDRYLLNSVCDDFYRVHDGQVEPFEGDLEDYRRWLLQDAAQTDSIAVKAAKPALDRQQVKQREAAFRQQTQGLRKQIQVAEQHMDKAHKALADIEQKLSDPSLYSEDNKSKLQPLLRQQGELKTQLEEHEMQWLDAQDQLEQQTQAFQDELVSS